jgi:hypothetical protein
MTNEELKDLIVRSVATLIASVVIAIILKYFIFP